jgi:hypothetical protein
MYKHRCDSQRRGVERSDCREEGASLSQMQSSATMDTKSQTTLADICCFRLLITVGAKKSYFLARCARMISAVPPIRRQALPMVLGSSSGTGKPA